jgi:hypothetical protein
MLLLLMLQLLVLLMLLTLMLMLLTLLLLQMISLGLRLCEEGRVNLVVVAVAVVRTEEEQITEIPSIPFWSILS